MMHLLQQIPFWAWVLFPALFLGLVTYLVSKNWKTTILLTIAAMLLAWSTAGFHLFEVFLHNHFLGTYDEQGLPYKFSESGWELLLRAWPIWFVPMLIVILILFGMQWLWTTSHKKVIEITKEERTQKTYTSDRIEDQLEIQSLQNKLHVAQERIKSGKDPVSLKPQINSLRKKIKTFKAELSAKQIENKQLHHQVDALENDITRAKALIERLLDKKH